MSDQENEQTQNGTPTPDNPLHSARPSARRRDGFLQYTANRLNGLEKELEEKLRQLDESESDLYKYAQRRFRFMLLLWTFLFLLLAGLALLGWTLIGPSMLEVVALRATVADLQAKMEAVPISRNTPMAEPTRMPTLTIAPISAPTRTPVLTITPTPTATTIPTNTPTPSPTTVAVIAGKKYKLTKPDNLMVSASEDPKQIIIFQIPITATLQTVEGSKGNYAQVTLEVWVVKAIIGPGAKTPDDPEAKHSCKLVMAKPDYISVEARFDVDSPSSVPNWLPGDPKEREEAKNKVSPRLEPGAFSLDYPCTKGDYPQGDWAKIRITGWVKIRNLEEIK